MISDIPIIHSILDTINHAKPIILLSVAGLLFICVIIGIIKKIKTFRRKRESKIIFFTCEELGSVFDSYKKAGS